ncbi:hypothetical protein NOR_02009 [Metarhizium rileyi]|uniref:Mucin n=1 Tax=Metarhizium rileyi (strain RCEF 4871) TaxID=1649241 RepID=A0A167I7N1_METRR|nr:hypothetical protein NOR_02009 [Metarhizium rileyi RCEF 4871]
MAQIDNGKFRLAYPVSPIYQEMKSFLDLESPTRSSFSLSNSEFVHTGHNDSSFLLLDSVPGAAAIMDANAPSTFEKSESIASSTSARNSSHAARLGSSNSLATLPLSVSTVTTCATSHSSMRSRKQHDTLSNANQPFCRVRAPSCTDSSDVIEQAHINDPQNHKQAGLRPVDNYGVENALTPLQLQPECRSPNQHGRPIPASKPLQRSAHRRPLSSDGQSQPLALTRDEFEALPPTIQRKYFSTLERLRIIRSQDHPGKDNSGSQILGSVCSALTCNEEDKRPTLRLGFGDDELENAPHRRSQGPALRIYAKPGNWLRRNCHASCDQLRGSRPRQSVILDATEESILRIKRQPHFDSLPGRLTSTKPKPDVMVSLTADAKTMGPDLKSTADSMYESLRCLEDDEDLDLTLCLNKHQFDLRSEDVTAQKHRPSFRRHLSMSKLPFSSRAPSTSSRPTTKDTTTSPPLTGSPHASMPGSPVHSHVRRRSRALSLMSPNKQSAPEASLSIDPAAAHYQDPDARMKLRVYLASPHKFDEAVEFGFPSIEEVQSNARCPGRPNAVLQYEQPTSAADKLSRTPEDDSSSIYSDEVSSAEPDSPKTPEVMEKSVAVKPVRLSQEKDLIANKIDYAQAPAAYREMTLRMTLTRPDLRANEDQIYGWQKVPNNGRKSLAREESLSPVSATGNSKESIERHLATLEHEHLLANDNGVMKRLWNRVRRS